MNPHCIINGRPARLLPPGRGAGLMAVLMGALLLAGCGQKGPLWVPGHAKNTPWPMKPAPDDDNTPPPKPVPPAAPGASDGTGPATSPK